MPLNKSLMSSKRDSWNTPECVLDLVRKVGPIGLDPCSNSEAILTVGAAFSLTAGGLEADWDELSGSNLIYVNPPYGREIGKWVDKCAYDANTETIALLPARTDAKWFQTCWRAAALCFWRGRLRFVGAQSSAPFPSVLVYWGARPYHFADVFSEVGKVVMP